MDSYQIVPGMQDMNDRLERIEHKLDNLTKRIDEMIHQALQARLDLQITRNMIETAEAAKLAQNPPLNWPYKTEI